MWARQAGLLTGVLSARTAAATTERARQLGMAVVRQQAADKAVAFAEILAEQGLAAEDVAYMGDDLMDLPVLRLAGVSAAPADARRRRPRPRPLRQPPARRRPAPCASSSRACCAPRTAGRPSPPATGAEAMEPAAAAARRRLVALLAGLAVGKAWERYKLQEGRWIDRRRNRESPHYMQGLNFLVTNQLDLAIEEMGQAAALAPDALEIHMILGNLYREKGQVSRAVQIHQQLLQRPRLGRLEHTYVLLCLGLDYRRGGFVDRAIEAFQEVLRLDPTNEHALLQLEKLYEDQHKWAEAARDPRAPHRDRRAEPAAAPSHHPRLPRERDRPAGPRPPATTEQAATALRRPPSSIDAARGAGLRQPRRPARWRAATPPAPSRCGRR